MASVHSASSEMIRRMRRIFGGLGFRWAGAGLGPVFMGGGPELAPLTADAWRWMLNADWLRDPGPGDVAGMSCMLAAGEARAGSPLATCNRKLLKLEDPRCRQDAGWGVVA